MNDERDLLEKISGYLPADVRYESRLCKNAKNLRCRELFFSDQAKANSRTNSRGYNYDSEKRSFYRSGASLRFEATAGRWGARRLPLKLRTAKPHSALCTKPGITSGFARTGGMVQRHRLEKRRSLFEVDQCADLQSPGVAPPTPLGVLQLK